MNIPITQYTLLESMLERKIFRAYDIRGNINILTTALIRHIGFALGSVLHRAKQTQVVVGYDARLSSATYAQSMAESLQASGLDVIFIGCVSSPVLYFTAHLYGGNGVMITASHNAVTDNGVKWLMQDLPPTPEQIQAIADKIDTQDYDFSQGSMRQLDPLVAYYAYLQQDIQLSKTLKISIDGFHGSAGAIAKTALQQLGCQVNALHCYADGHFPLGAPDPSDPQRLKLLQQAVHEHQSDLGIALDGDGDRLVVLDEYGQYVSPDRLMGLFSKICLDQSVDKQKTNKQINQQKHKALAQAPDQRLGKEVVCDVKCSSLIGKTVQQYGGQLKMIRTGSSFLRNYLAHAKGKAIFGGEFAGHYVFNDGRGKGDDDGLYAGLRLLEYMSQQQGRLSEILQEFPERISTNDVYIACQGVDGQHIMQLIEQNAPQHAQIIKVDGLRLDFPFGFGIIRASNTGEYFTVRFDADTPTHFDYIRQLFVNALVQHYPKIAQAMADAD